MNEAVKDTEIKTVDKSIKRFRKPLRIIMVLIAAAALVLFGVGMLAQPCDRTNAAYSNFVVEEGEGLHEVAEKLDEAGMVKSSSGFELLAKLRFAGDFRPGTYFLSPSMSGISIIQTLTRGLTTSEGFTIPAGYTVDQIATALDRDGIADKDAFLHAAGSPELAQMEILSGGKGRLKGKDLIEGFLFPGDYTLSGDADESMIIIMMIDAFSNFYNEDYQARADELGMDVRDVLVIASLIEKETSVDSERAAISAVIHNRYNLGMTPKDEIYDIPLCSPGRESIEAALYPEEREETYYVLSSRLDGTHRFTSDESEYNELLQEYNEAVAAREQERAKKQAEKEAAEAEAEAGEAETGSDVSGAAGEGGAE